MGETQSEFVTCQCNNCDGRIEFAKEHVGDTTNCPHCGVETVLFLQEESATPEPKEEPPPPEPEPKTAKLVETTEYKPSGVEGRVELNQPREYRSGSSVENPLRTVGAVVGVMCILGGSVALLTALGDPASTDGHSGVWAAVGVVAILQGTIAWLLFSAVAEIIRLLKQANASNFSGKIIQVSVQHSYKCSLCNAAAKAGQINCSRCGAELKP